MELGDKVYYKDSKNSEPIGTLVGIRETSWSDDFSEVQYSVLTPRGKVTNIFGNIITNVKPV